MHTEAENWLRAQSATLKGLECVDLGGRNVNGSIRDLFEPASWTAVDFVDGPGVDIVADIRSWEPHRRWDLVVCTEVLEHVRVPAFVLDTIARCVAPGGTILITAAAPPRAPHSMCGSNVVPPGEPYSNIHPAVLTAQMRIVTKTIDEVVHDARHGDVYLRATAP